MKKIIKTITDFFLKIQETRRFKKKLKELKKRDPFIYKH